MTPRLPLQTCDASSVRPHIIRYVLIWITCAVLLQLAGCAMFSGSVVIPVSESERTTVEAYQATLSLVSMPLVTTPSPGRTLKIYPVAFDGTLNDRTRVAQGERATIVAHVSSLVKAKYYAGAGMQGIGVNYADALLGTTAARVAEQAATDFERQAHAWLAVDSGTEIRIFVTGFSRGAATARHFMNIVRDRWKQSMPSNASSHNEPHFYALLFDTVSTGQSDRLNLKLPESLDYLIHFVARDDPRKLFEPVIDTVSNGLDAQPVMGFSNVLPPDRINLMLLPGAHSDIGASYSQGIGDEYIRAAEKILYKLGLSANNCWDVRVESYRQGKHDPRGVLDVAAGRARPNSDRTESRRYASLPMEPLPLERSHELTQKLMRLAVANAERGESIASFKSTEVGLTLKVIREGDGIRVQSYTPDMIDPASFSFTYADGIRKLRYHFLPPYEHRASVLVFSEGIWRRLKPGILHELSYSTLYRDGKTFQATHVNGVLAALDEATYGDTLFVSSSDFRCRRTGGDTPAAALPAM